MVQFDTLWILLVLRVLRYSNILVSQINAASDGTVSSVEGQNTPSAGNVSIMKNPE